MASIPEQPPRNLKREPTAMELAFQQAGVTEETFNNLSPEQMEEAARGWYRTTQTPEWSEMIRSQPPQSSLEERTGDLRVAFAQLIDRIHKAKDSTDPTQSAALLEEARGFFREMQNVEPALREGSAAYMAAHKAKQEAEEAAERRTQEEAKASAAAARAEQEAKDARDKEEFERVKAAAEAMPSDLDIPTPPRTLDSTAKEVSAVEPLPIVTPLSEGSRLSEEKGNGLIIDNEAPVEISSRNEWKTTMLNLFKQAGLKFEPVAETVKSGIERAKKGGQYLADRAFKLSTVINAMGDAVGKIGVGMLDDAAALTQGAKAVWQDPKEAYRSVVRGYERANNYRKFLLDRDQNKNGIFKQLALDYNKLAPQHKVYLGAVLAAGVTFGGGWSLAALTSPTAITSGVLSLGQRALAARGFKENQESKFLTELGSKQQNVPEIQNGAYNREKYRLLQKARNQGLLYFGASALGIGGVVKIFDVVSQTQWLGDIMGHDGAIPGEVRMPSEPFGAPLEAQTPLETSVPSEAAAFSGPSGTQMGPESPPPPTVPPTSEGPQGTYGKSGAVATPETIKAAAEAGKPQIPPQPEIPPTVSETTPSAGALTEASSFQEPEVSAPVASNGIEWTLKHDILDQLKKQNIDIGSVPEGSDLETLLKAPKGLERAVHDIAVRNGLLEKDANGAWVSPPIKSGTVVSFDEKGMLTLEQGPSVPKGISSIPTAPAPEGPSASTLEANVKEQFAKAGKAPGYDPIEARIRLREIDNQAAAEAFKQQYAVEHPGIVPSSPETPSAPETSQTSALPPLEEGRNPAVLNEPVTAREMYEGAVPPAPDESAVQTAALPEGFQLNASGVPVDLNHPHLYSDSPDGKGNLIIYGGTTEERTVFALKLLEKNPNAVVYYDSTKPGLFGFGADRHELTRAIVDPATRTPQLLNNSMDPSLIGKSLPAIDDLKAEIKINPETGAIL